MIDNSTTLTISQLRRTRHPDLMEMTENGPVVLGQFGEEQEDGVAIMRVKQIRELTEKAEGRPAMAGEAKVRHVINAAADPIVEHGPMAESFGALLAAMAEQTTQRIVDRWFEERLEHLREVTEGTLAETEAKARQAIDDTVTRTENLANEVMQRSARILSQAEQKADETVRQAHEQAAGIISSAQLDARQLTAETREASLSCTEAMIRKHDEIRQVIEEAVQASFAEMRTLMEDVRGTLRDERLAQIQETEARLRGVLGAANMILSSEDERAAMHGAPHPEPKDRPVPAVFAAPLPDVALQVADDVAFAPEAAEEADEPEIAPAGDPWTADEFEVADELQATDEVEAADEPRDADELQAADEPSGTDDDVLPEFHPARTMTWFDPEAEGPAGEPEDRVEKAFTSEEAPAPVRASLLETMTRPAPIEVVPPPAAAAEPEEAPQPRRAGSFLDNL